MNDTPTYLPKPWKTPQAVSDIGSAILGDDYGDYSNVIDTAVNRDPVVAAGLRGQQPKVVEGKWNAYGSYNPLLDAIKLYKGTIQDQIIDDPAPLLQTLMHEGRHRAINNNPDARSIVPDAHEELMVSIMDYLEGDNGAIKNLYRNDTARPTDDGISLYRDTYDILRELFSTGTVTPR